MTIDQIHTFIKFLANLGQNRYFTPEEIDQAINSAQLDKFNQEIDFFQKNSKVSDQMKDFITEASVSISSGTGTLPSDYEYRLSVSDSSDVPVEIIEESEWKARINSDIEAPSTSYPICIIRSDISVRPTSLTSVKLTYFKTPADVEWAYTTSINDLIYDSGSSTQLEWPDSAHVDIVLRSCVYLGIPIDDQGLTQLKAYKKQTENV